MPLDRDEVSRIASLARLALTPTEEEQLAEQLGDILQAFAKLGSLDVADIEPTSHAVEIADAYRDDVVSNPPSSPALRANAPDVDGTHFRVPKIIE